MSDITLASMILDYLLYLVFFMLGIWVGKD